VVLAALLAGLLGGGLAAAAVVGLDDGGDTSVSAPETVDKLPTSGSAEPLPAGNSSVVAVADRTLPSVVQIKVSGANGESGTGSGFVLDERGHVVTNNHVVEVASEEGRITVVFQDGSERRAEIVGRSPSYDIAVIKVNSKGLVATALGRSSSLQVGQTVVAVGSPLGLSSTVTSGIVSALERPVTTGSSDANSYISAIQTDAAINPGNSGGPLVDMRGRVVGVNTAIAQVGALGGQSGNIGVGFAVPIDQVQRTAAQILADGEARYPVIGASVNTTESRGATVSDVTDGGPAQTAGLRPGDVVIEVDGVAIEDGTQLIVAIRSYQPGDTITLTYERNGDRLRVDVVLDSQVDDVD
jgi:putative serine protease PepD